MVDIRPFRGVRYDAAKAGDLCDLISGPYDVISPEKQEELYQRHTHNVVRLELGKEFPSDTPQENRYTKAAATLQQWLREGVLLRDKVQSFYLDRHQFSLGGKELVRWGLLAAVSLEDLNRRQILPHEKTTEKPKQDRLELLKSCHTSFSPIMALYSDPKRQVASLLAISYSCASTLLIASSASWTKASFPKASASPSATPSKGSTTPSCAMYEGSLSRRPGWGSLIQ